MRMNYQRTNVTAVRRSKLGLSSFIRMGNGNWKTDDYLKPQEVPFVVALYASVFEWHLFIGSMILYYSY